MFLLSVYSEKIFSFVISNKNEMKMIEVITLEELSFLKGGESGEWIWNGEDWIFILSEDSDEE